eukprot:462144-Prymnesium_polylepis.1
MIGLWPIGVPLLYFVLLWQSRDALRTETPTPLSRAIEFLSEDYQAIDHGMFWWEPLEMFRKLILTGWVLLLEDAVQARLLVAICVSVVFLALQLSIKPLRR